MRPVDLEVVVVLGVQLGDRLGAQTSSRCATAAGGRVAGVVPALERGDHDRVDQLGHALELDHPYLLAAPRGVRHGMRQPDVPVVVPSPRPSDEQSIPTRPTPCAQRSTERVVVADGAMGTMLQAQDPSLDDFQGHEGCNEILNVTRPDIVRGGPRRLLRGRRRLRRDQHLRRQPRQPRRVRHRRPHLRARRGRRPASPARSADALVDRRTGRAGCSARSGPAPSCPRSGHVAVRRAARRLRRAGRRA